MSSETIPAGIMSDQASAPTSYMTRDLYALPPGPRKLLIVFAHAIHHHETRTPGETTFGSMYPYWTIRQSKLATIAYQLGLTDKRRSRRTIYRWTKKAIEWGAIHRTPRKRKIAGQWRFLSNMYHFAQWFIDQIRAAIDHYIYQRTERRQEITGAEDTRRQTREIGQRTRALKLSERGIKPPRKDPRPFTATAPTILREMIQDTESRGTISARKSLQGRSGRKEQPSCQNQSPENSGSVTFRERVDLATTVPKSFVHDLARKLERKWLENHQGSGTPRKRPKK